MTHTLTFETSALQRLLVRSTELTGEVIRVARHVQRDLLPRARIGRNDLKQPRQVCLAEVGREAGG